MGMAGELQMSGIIEILGLVGTGGGISLIQQLASFAVDASNKKREMQIKQQEFDHELKLLEIKGRDEEQENYSELVAAAADHSAKVMEASYTHDTGYGEGPPWLVAVLRLVRPMLTFSILLAVVIFTVRGVGEVGESIDTLKDLLVVMVSWWFGDRSSRALELRK